MTGTLLTALFDSENLLEVPRFCSPGWWVVLTAWAHQRKRQFSDLRFLGNNAEYAKAIKLEDALSDGQLDSYPYFRKGAGCTYSPITRVCSAETVDLATQTISACLRELAPPDCTGVRELGKVVGELHDNVYSHGKSTGFSMAQRTKVPHEEDSYIEFAIADHGLGFLEEIERAKLGLQIANHQEAISWCMQKGNSTKLLKEDGWAQTLPDDHVGMSPFGHLVETRTTANHHQGLGLFKLQSFAKEFQGELCVASGDSAYLLSDTGEESWIALPVKWRGVAISCRLRATKLQKLPENAILNSDQMNYLMARLEGSLK